MKNIVNPIPSTIDELKQNTGSFKTKSEQIEYLAEIKYVFQRDMSQDKNIENCDLDDAIQDLKKKLEHPERVDIEQIRSIYKKLSEVRDTINSNKKDPEYYSSDKKKMIKYAEKEINNLGGKPEKWIEYPLVTNVHDFNVRKESMKDEGRLLEWVKWLLNNVELPVEENEGIKKDLGWSYNDRVLRQAKLDCIEQGKEYVVQKWDASNLDNDFVDHLERQLKTNTDLLTPKPKRNFSRISPISIFIDEQISNGRYDWQKAWSELRDKIADDKNTKTEDMKLHNFGEKEAFVRRTMKQTSNKLDHAIEYQEDGMPTFKTVSRQDFGRMFREALKKVGVSRRLRNNSDSIPLR